MRNIAPIPTHAACLLLRVRTDNLFRRLEYALYALMMRWKKGKAIRTYHSRIGHHVASFMSASIRTQPWGNGASSPSGMPAPHCVFFTVHSTCANNHHQERVLTQGLPLSAIARYPPHSPTATQLYLQRTPSPRFIKSTRTCRNPKYRLSALSDTARPIVS